MTGVIRKNNPGYIGYMYIGTTLMVCRNALKDINETWYALAFIGCRTNGLSDYWVVGLMSCRTNGPSDYREDPV